jgi:hypothetical protein
MPTAHPPAAGGSLASRRSSLAPAMVTQARRSWPSSFPATLGQQRPLSGRSVRPGFKAACALLGCQVAAVDARASHLALDVRPSVGLPGGEAVLFSLRPGSSLVAAGDASPSPQNCRALAQGYTSLGSVSTTLPNPMLRQPGGTFAHANQLRDSRHERCGRGKQPQVWTVAGFLINLGSPAPLSGTVGLGLGHSSSRALAAIRAHCGARRAGARSVVAGLCRGGRDVAAAATARRVVNYK